MTTATQGPGESPRVIAVIGASSTFGALMLAHLETEMPGCQLVAIDAYPLVKPVKHVSAYRMEPNRTGAILTIDDIPEVMQFKAWDMVLDNRRLTIADAPDVFHLESVDCVVHVGSHYDRDNPHEFLEDTQHWIQACRLAGIGQFIYVSDIRIYGVGSAHPVPLTERSKPEPPSEHRPILEAESAVQQEFGVSSSGGGLKVAILRSAMAVGPSGSSPVADELFWNTLSSSGNGNVSLQLVHHYDLANAIQFVMKRQLEGVYNVASKGVIGTRALREMNKSAIANRLRRPPRRPKSKNRHMAKHPLIISDTKLKQATGFEARYSSEQAARAYCHSYLMAPSTRHGLLSPA